MNPGELHNPSSEEETLMTCNTMTSWVIKKRKRPKKEDEKYRKKSGKKILLLESVQAFFCASYFDSFWEEDEHEEKLLRCYLSRWKCNFCLHFFALYKVQLEYKKSQTPQFP